MATKKVLRLSLLIVLLLLLAVTVRAGVTAMHTVWFPYVTNVILDIDPWPLPTATPYLNEPPMPTATAEWEAR
jgi:hypothetical protein